MLILIMNVFLKVSGLTVWTIPKGQSENLTTTHKVQEHQNRNLLHDNSKSMVLIETSTCDTLQVDRFQSGTSNNNRQIHCVISTWYFSHFFSLVHIHQSKNNDDRIKKVLHSFHENLEEIKMFHYRLILIKTKWGSNQMHQTF